MRDFDPSSSVGRRWRFPRSRLSALCVLLPAVACGYGPLRRPALTQGEEAFRATATMRVDPIYPIALLRSHVAGVAVAKVSVRPDGTVGHVEVDEAPHSEMARSMVVALSQWTFPRVRIPGTLLFATVDSRVTYYFALTDGVGVVRSPAEQAALQKALDGPTTSIAKSPNSQED